MSISNYLLWVAEYPNFTIVEDQTIADHFLKIPHENLLSLSYIDGETKYKLLCTSGVFAINDFLVVSSINGVMLSSSGKVNSAILKPSQEFLMDGVFQYKHCSADTGARGITTSLLGTYNIGFRKTLNFHTIYQKLAIDSKTEQVSITCRLLKHEDNSIYEATSIIDIPKTRTSLVVP